MMKADKQKTKPSFSAAEFVYSVLGTLLLCMFCVFVAFTFVFRLVSVSGSSMEPGLHNNDKLIISGLFYTPDYGDIIAIERAEEEQKCLIKRVIALGGDTVDINFETHLITVNGRVFTEDYAIASAIQKQGDVTFPVTVPENCVFVLGDNRNNSIDSRYTVVGFIENEEIAGKVLCRIFPIGQFRVK